MEAPVVLGRSQECARPCTLPHESLTYARPHQTDHFPPAPQNGGGRAAPTLGGRRGLTGPAPRAPPRRGPARERAPFVPPPAPAVAQLPPLRPSPPCSRPARCGEAAAPPAAAAAAPSFLGRCGSGPRAPAPAPRGGRRRAGKMEPRPAGEGSGEGLSSPRSAPSPPLRAIPRSPRPGVRCLAPRGRARGAAPSPPAPLSPPGCAPGRGPGPVGARRAGHGTHGAAPGAVSSAAAESEGAVPLCPLSRPLAAPGGAGPSCCPACGRELFLPCSTRSSVRGAAMCAGLFIRAYSHSRGASGCVRTAHGCISRHT